MTTLTKGDVIHVAKLAKLKLTHAEIAKFQKQLSEIVNYISELAQVNTSKTQATSQTTGLTNVFREDKIDLENCLTDQEAFYFEIPPIFEK